MHRLKFWIIALVISFGIVFRFDFSGNLSPLVTKQAIAESREIQP